MAETTGEVANTDAVILEMGKPRHKVTPGHRQQKSSHFRKQTQSFSITQSPLQCFIWDIKDSPQPLSAGVTLQHGVYISKQCNRSSLLSSSHLPPPCPWVREAVVNVQFSKKTTVSLIVPLILIPGAPQKSILISAPLQERGVLVFIDLSFGKIQRRRGYCFSPHRTCAISQTRSLQLVFFVK